MPIMSRGKAAIPQKENAAQESERARIDAPHFLESNPHLDSLKITKTADAVVFPGPIDSTDARDVLRQVAGLLLQQTSETVQKSRTGDLMEARSDQVRTDPQLTSRDSDAGQHDVLDWDNLIPVAPARPTGRIRVRLKKARRDEPLPAEDPWAK